MAADTLVNHTYNSLAQGVSEQSTEARHETQVEQMLNCVPHISRGVLRRNPLEHITNIVDKDGLPISPEDYFVYSYDRGTIGEQYVFLLGNQKWYVFDITGALKGSYNDTTNIGINLSYLNTNGLHPKEVFSLVTVGDYTWVSNNQITTAMIDLTDGLSPTYHKSVAVYTVKSTGNVVTRTTTVSVGDTNTATPTLEGYTYNVKVRYNDNNLPSHTDIATLTSGNTYTTGSEVATAIKNLLNGGRAAGITEAVVEGPKYQITNPTGKVISNFAVVLVDGVYNFYWNTALIGRSNTSTLTVGIYTYALSGSLKYERSANYFYAIKRTHYKVIEAAATDGVWVAEGPIVYRRSVLESATIEYNDSFGNTASYAFKGVVPSSDKLPDTLPVGVGDVLVKVDSSEKAEGGEYWLKWDGDVWAESRGPGLKNSIDETTMPHTFLRAEDGTFSFGFYGEFNGEVNVSIHEKPNSSNWSDRLKGDESSAPEPSFIGKKVADMFIHNNRLGVLAEDAIVLSELAEYGNFFPTTIRSIPATDPIDIIVATTDVTGLRKAVSLSGTLLLFSDEAQFALTGSGEALTPESAIVNAVSRYNYSSKAPAKVLGNKVLFTTESGNGTQLFTMATDAIAGGGNNIAADNISLHIPTYLPSNINYIASHSILGYLFMLSPDEPNALYVLNTLDVNKQSAQSAFHKWTFGANILGISVLDNSLLLMMNDGGVLKGYSLALDVPTDVSTVTYSDEVSSGVFTNYESYVTLSKWFIKDGNGFGNKRGRLQIRTALFSVGQTDKYKIQIFNDSIINPVPTDEDWVMTNAVWNDAAYWGYNATDDDDSKVHWKDALPFFSRLYHNDEKVTVTSNSATTFIRFGSSNLEPTKGFTLSTVNLEGLFHQRSQRL